MNPCRKVILLWIVMVVGLTLSCRRLAQDSGDPPEIQWIRSYSGQIKSIRQCPDGGHLLVGSKGYPGKKYDIFVIKISMEGDSIWAKNYGGGRSEHPSLAAMGSDGGLILSGCSIENGEYSYLYMKTDSLGDSLFGDRCDFPICAIMKADNRENILISKMESSILFTGINAEGDTLWSKSKQVITDRFGILQISDSLVIAIYDGDEGEIPLKMESDGTIIWKKHLSGAIRVSWYNLDLEAIIDEGFFLVGTSRDFPTRLYLAKADDSLNLIWDKTYDIAGSGVGYSIRKISTDEYIVLGTGEAFGVWNFDTPYWFEYLIALVGVRFSTVSKLLELMGIGFYSNLLIYKINSDGGIIWRKRIMTKVSWDIYSYDASMVYCTLTAPRFWERFVMEITSDNGIIVGGYFDGDEGEKTSHLIKLKPEE